MLQTLPQTPKKAYAPPTLEVQAALVEVAEGPGAVTTTGKLTG